MEEKYQPSKILALAIIFACLVLGVILRVSNHSFVLAPVTGHFNFIDTDCYYYLRRLVHYLANFPHIMVFDPLLDWPMGGSVDWPEGFLFILGIPLKLVGVDSFQGLEMGVATLMIALGLSGCLLIYLAGRRVVSDFSLQILVLFFAVCNFLLIRFSCLGQVDHHIMEALFPPAVYLLSLKAFEEHSLPSSVFLGLLLTYSLTISSSSLFVIVAFFGGYGLVLGSRENLKLYGICLAAFIGSLFLYALWSIARRGNPYADNYPSYFHLSLVSLLTVLGFVVALHRKWALIILPAVVGLAYVCTLLGWPAILVSPLTAAFSYVFGKSGVLQNVSEAFPLYASYNGFALDFMHINFGYLVYLLPLAWLSNFIFRSRWSLSEKLLFCMLSMMSVPAIAQKRFSHLMIGLYLIFLVWVLQQIFSWFRKIDFKVQIPLILTWMTLTVAIPLSDGGFAPSGSPRDAVDLGASKLFLDTIQVDPKLAWDRLAGKVKSDDGVWANPNMGHMLLYYTGLGNVVNSFYHTPSFDLEFKLRNIEDQDEFKKELRANKIRYLILADDWQFFELQFHLRGLSTARFHEPQKVNGQMRNLYSMSEFMKLAWARMLLIEDSFTGFDRLFSIQTHENHYYNFVRGYRFGG